MSCNNVCQELINFVNAPGTYNYRNMLKKKKKKIYFGEPIDDEKSKTITIEVSYPNLKDFSKISVTQSQSCSITTGDKDEKRVCELVTLKYTELDNEVFNHYGEDKKIIFYEEGSFTPSTSGAYHLYQYVALKKEVIKEIINSNEWKQIRKFIAGEMTAKRVLQKYGLVR